jgi:hypothetical protein
VRHVMSRITSWTATRITTRMAVSPRRAGYPDTCEGLARRVARRGLAPTFIELTQSARRPGAGRVTRPSGRRSTPVDAVFDQLMITFRHHWCNCPEREKIREIESRIRDLRGMCWCGHRHRRRDSDRGVARRVDRGWNGRGIAVDRSSSASLVPRG